MKGSGVFRPIVEELMKHARALANMRGMDGVDVTPNVDGGYDFSGTGSSSYRQRPFGFGGVDVTERKILVRGGWILRGEQQLIVADTAVIVAGGTRTSPTHGFLEYVFNPGGGGSARIVPATVTDRPRHSLGDAPIFRRTLFRAYLLRGIPTLLDWRWDGDVDLTGWFVD